MGATHGSRAFTCLYKWIQMFTRIFNAQTNAAIRLFRKFSRYRLLLCWWGLRLRFVFWHTFMRLIFFYIYVSIIIIVCLLVVALLSHVRIIYLPLDFFMLLLSKLKLGFLCLVRILICLYRRIKCSLKISITTLFTILIFTVVSYILLWIILRKLIVSRNQFRLN